MPKDHFLPPKVLQVAGLAIVLGAVVFWAITGHQSALVMGAGLSLTALGAYSGLHVTVSQDYEPRKNPVHVEPDDGPG